MIRLAQLTVLAMVLLEPTTALQKARRGRSKRNQAPIIQSFTASKEVVDLCPTFPGGPCSDSGTIVKLEVKAADSDNGALSYNYLVSAGAIAGNGSVVNWDLTESRLGMQTARVEVTDGQGAKTSATAHVNLIVCSACDQPCSTLSVSCPANVIEGEIASFEAWVSGRPHAANLIYLWSHSNGKRIANQAGPKLGIKAVGSPGDVITATVTVLGLDPSCNRQASCESTIEKRRPSSSEK